jgi:hypothetical protein
MASYLTILHNFDQPTYSPDFDFISAALSYKQQKYDANQAKLQTLYDQIGSLQVEKDVDKKYIESRLQQVKSIANKYSYVDLSDDSFAQSMLGNIGQVIDGAVENAVLSKRRIASENVDFEKRKTAAIKAGKYDPNNDIYSYAMSDRKRYLDSQEVGDEYGGGYEFFEAGNVKKELTDNSLKLIKELEAEYITRGPSAGPFQSFSTYKEVSRERLEKALMDSLSPTARKQMEIDAWFQYNQLPDEEVAKRYQTTLEKEKTTLGSHLKDLKLTIDSNADETKKQELQKHYDEIQKRYQSYDEIDPNEVVKKVGKRAVYEDMHKKQVYGEVLDAFSYGPRFIKNEIDQTLKAKIEFEEGQRQFNVKQNWEKYKFENLSLKEKKDLELKAIELGLKYPESEFGKPRATTVDAEPEIGIDYKKEGEISASSLIFKQRNEAIAKTKQMFGLEKLDFNELNPILSNLNERIAKGEKVKIGGNNYDLGNPEVAKTLLGLKIQLAGTPLEKDARERTLKSVETTIDKLVGYYTKKDFRDFPNYDFEIKGGKLEKTKEGKHNYALLLAKKAKGENLSLDQEKTLKYYTALHIAQDKSSAISQDDREFIVASARKELLKGVDATTFKNGITTYEGLGREKSSVPTSGIPVAGVGTFLSTKIKPEKGRTAEGFSISEIDRKLLTDVQTNMQLEGQKILDQNKYAFPQKLAFQLGQENYDDLKTYLKAKEVIGKDYKEMLYIEPSDMATDGSVTKVKVFGVANTNVKDATGVRIPIIQRTGGIEMTVEELRRQVPNLKIEQLERTPFDASSPNPMVLEFPNTVSRTLQLSLLEKVKDPKAKEKLQENFDNLESKRYVVQAEVHEGRYIAVLKDMTQPPSKQIIKTDEGHNLSSSLSLKAATELLQKSDNVIGRLLIP